MKVELPFFNGNVSIEKYLDCVSEDEKFFDYISTPDDKQVFLRAYKLKGGICLVGLCSVKPNL